MTYPAHIEQQAREIAERHGYPQANLCRRRYEAMLCEALLTTPLNENGWHLPSVNEGLRIARVCNGHALPDSKFCLGDRVTKTKGSSWTGKVVGFYATSLTPIGYAVESENERGSVQIYPESALTTSEEETMTNSPATTGENPAKAQSATNAVGGPVAGKTPTKPDELPEWALREACNELNVDTPTRGWDFPLYADAPAVRTVARLLVRIKELEGPKRRPWCETCGKDVQEVLCPTCTKWWHDNPPPEEDPYLVLAREMAAQDADEQGALQTAIMLRQGKADNTIGCRTALRTIKRLREAGWKEGA